MPPLSGSVSPLGPSAYLAFLRAILYNASPSELLATIGQTHERPATLLIDVLLPPWLHFCSDPDPMLRLYAFSCLECWFERVIEVANSMSAEGFERAAVAAQSVMDVVNGNWGKGYPIKMRLLHPVLETLLKHYLVRAFVVVSPSFSADRFDCGLVNLAEHEGKIIPHSRRS